MIESERLIYARAIDVYGHISQVHVCSEEMSELNFELMKSLRNDNRDNIAGIVDELTDVLIMVEQMIISYGVEKQVNERKKFKLIRLINRMDLTQKHSED